MEWVPRDQNEEADALTNSDFRHFSADKRIDVDLSSLLFLLMNDLFEEGEAYLAELEALKVQDRERRVLAKESAAGKRKKGQTLRDKDPW